MKKLTIILAGLLIIILGGIFYFWSRQPLAEIAPLENFQSTDELKLNQTPVVKKFYAPVLAYHHISYTWPQNSYYVSPKIFDSQMKYLKDNGYQVISLDLFYDAFKNSGELPEKPVVLTFDDGNADQYTKALPILKKYNYTATFFIKLNNIGKGGMSWEQIKTLAKEGMIIGSHTVNHDNLTRLSDKQLRYELTESKKVLEEKLGAPVKYLCYPGGAYSAKVIDAAKDAGYLAAVATKHKVYQEYRDENSLYTIPRVHIDDEMPTFTQWIRGINLF